MPTVLVVDDHPENTYFLHVLLAGNGYDVLTAEHGAAALALALDQPPDLIISDILMPVMDGFRLCRSCKQNPVLSSIPFVFYTATYTDQQDEQFALSLGADRFIIKPAEPEFFMAQIQEVLKQHQTGSLFVNVNSSTDDTYIQSYNAVLIRKLEQKMTMLEEAHRQLQSSEARLRAIGSASPDVICVLDQQGRVLESLNGNSSLLPTGAIVVGSNLLSQLPPVAAQQLAALILRTITTNTNHEIELMLTLPVGERWLEGRIAPLSQAIIGVPAVVVVARDSTRRKMVEHALQQSQKMEAIGRLTAGIAHDFNNLLTVINGYSGMLLTMLDESDTDMRPELEQVHQAGERAAALTRQLLAFSRKQVLNLEMTSLNEVIASIDKLLRRVIGEDIDLIIEPAPDLWAVLADHSQMTQVMINLVVNARDAMPNGGRLTVNTTNVALRPEVAVDGIPIPAGNYVLLMVSDNGCGMSPEVQARIFEPFFTTKAPGIGTGLGLAVVYGIVTQSGGFIRVTSAPGLGTTIYIYLPYMGEAAQNLEPQSATIDTHTCNETVLVVEDDVAVRGFVRLVLEQHGYRVLEAANGTTAQDVAEKHTGIIHLLLSDIVLPDQSGVELAQHLAAVYPTIQVLFMSGYPDDVLDRYHSAQPRAGFLTKPFDADTLTYSIRDVLDAAPK